MTLTDKFSTRSIVRFTVFLLCGLAFTNTVSADEGCPPRLNLQPPRPLLGTNNAPTDLRHPLLDHNQAWQQLSQRAQRGESGAQYAMANSYLKGCFAGQTFPRDPAQAASWLRLAADQDHAEAQSKLGVLYENGQGVNQDYVEARKWYEKVLKQEGAKVVDARSAANHGLGRLYAGGLGVPRNDRLAVEHFKMNHNAHEDMSDMYVAGRGVPQDLVQAYFWLTIGVESVRTTGNTSSELSPALTAKINSLAARMNSAQLAEAKRLVDEVISGNVGGTYDIFPPKTVPRLQPAKPYR